VTQGGPRGSLKRALVQILAVAANAVMTPYRTEVEKGFM